MLSQITTKSFNVFLSNGAIVSAKCRSTGRFVKRAIAQVELKVELKQRANLKNRITVLQAHNIKQAARMKDRLNMQAKSNVKTAINNSLVEKVALVLNSFNSGKTVVVIAYKQTELYNVKLHSEDMLLNALYSAVTVRLI